MPYRIVKCRWESGERYRMLVDAETGMPTWWPTLFVTTQLRNRGHSVSTMDTALGAIQILLSFLEERGIDLKKRILTGQFLEASEIDDLCDRAQKRRRGRRGGSKSRRPDVVSPGHHYNRLSGIATYLNWLATEMLGNRGGIEEAKSIERMVRMVRARRPNWHRKNHEEDHGLSDEAYARLSEIIEPRHPDNPFNDEHVAIRNRLIIVLLVHTGMRLGELLGLQATDINWSTGTVSIERRHDDDHDPRKDQPRAKTQERDVAIPQWLLEDLDDYIRQVRKRTKRALTHRYLFVVHKKGPNEGKPLDKAGCEAIFKTLQDAEPVLSEVHPHAFRYLWNYVFSKDQDAKPDNEKKSREEQEDIRCHQMGWVPGSAMAKGYNRRFVKEQAQEAALTLAEKFPTRATQD